MHLYRSLGILLNDNNKLKTATVLFLHKKHNSVSSFWRGASRETFNDFPFNLIVPRQLSAESKSSKLYKYFIHIKIGCAFFGDIIQF